MYRCGMGRHFFCRKVTKYAEIYNETPQSRLRGGSKRAKATFPASRPGGGAGVGLALRLARFVPGGPAPPGAPWRGGGKCRWPLQAGNPWRRRDINPSKIS